MVISAPNGAPHMKREIRQQKSESIVNLGLYVNVVLAGAKTLAGIFGHSQALLADGINSTSDVVYYVVVKIFMRLAGKPADPEHPYGHSQLESIAALIVGAFVITTGVAIFWDSVNKAYDLYMGEGDNAGASLWALAIALATIAVKVLLTRTTRGIGRATGNPAVTALAYDHRNDAISATAAALGIFIGRLGYRWVDPAAGALVAGVILRTGIKILQESSAHLMDTLPGQALSREIRDALHGLPGIRKVEEIDAHRFGPYFVINLTIGVDGALSMREGDQIAARAEQELKRRMELVKRVYVHYHPTG
jgi:cation diffusion facilitator family transporter